MPLNGKFLIGPSEAAYLPWMVLRTAYFWAKIKGGHFKNVKKLKKKTTKSF